MLNERTLSRIRSLGLDANGYMTVCEIAQEAIDLSHPKKKSLALQIPGDWPPDYRDQFWDAYPNRKDKHDAMKALDKVAFAGRTKWADLINGIEQYKLSRDVQRGFIKMPATFLNKGSWKNEEQTTPTQVERKGAVSFFDGLEI